MQLSNQEIHIIKEILNSFVPNAERWVFGSRACNQGAKYSDLDILLKTAEAISLATLGKLQEAFDESDLPFTVDLIDWHRITPEFRQLILKNAQKL